MSSLEAWQKSEKMARNSNFWTLKDPLNRGIGREGRIINIALCVYLFFLLDGKTLNCQSFGAFFSPFFVHFQTVSTWGQFVLAK